jgi:hypothetical protein
LALAVDPQDALAGGETHVVDVQGDDRSTSHEASPTLVWG